MVVVIYPIKGIWDGDFTKGCPKLNHLMSEQRWRSIHRHICFNPWKHIVPDANTSKFYKFEAGMNRICNHSCRLVYDGCIYSLDEIRVTCTAKANKNKTKMDKKPKKEAQDSHSVCSSTKNFSGFLHTALHYQGSKTYNWNIRATPTEKKMDNIVNQCVSRNCMEEQAIFVMDKRYGSVYGCDKMSEKYRKCGFVVMVTKDRSCLPKEFYKKGAAGATEIKNLQKGQFIQFHCTEKRLTFTI